MPDPPPIDSLTYHTFAPLVHQSLEFLSDPSQRASRFVPDILSPLSPIPASPHIDTLSPSSPNNPKDLSILQKSLNSPNSIPCP